MYLVELKDQRTNWMPHAIEQLESTIMFLRDHHDLTRFRTKKAFACNKRRKPFAHIDNELMLRFHRNYGFRIYVQATVLIIRTLKPI